MKLTAPEIIIPISILLVTSGVILGINLNAGGTNRNTNTDKNEQHPPATQEPPIPTHLAPTQTGNPYIPTANVAVSFRDPVQVADAPVQPPMKQNPYGTPPVQIATRGYPGPFQQIGVLTGSKSGDTGEPLLLPLYGRHLHNRSDRWEYQTASSGYHQMRLPLKRGGRQCIDTPGCEEIYNGDKIAVDGQNADFTATIYENDAPRYYPNVL